MARRPHGLFSGEDCTAGSRVYVQDTVYDKFIALLIDRVKSTPIGDGFDDAVTSGPIVSEHAGGVLSTIYTKP
jgi:aldehyde dehydrogenase (NAD+)